MVIICDAYRTSPDFSDGRKGEWRMRWKRAIGKRWKRGGGWQGFPVFMYNSYMYIHIVSARVVCPYTEKKGKIIGEVIWNTNPLHASSHLVHSTTRTHIQQYAEEMCLCECALRMYVCVRVCVVVCARTCLTITAFVRGVKMWAQNNRIWKEQNMINTVKLSVELFQLFYISFFEYLINSAPRTATTHPKQLKELRAADQYLARIFVQLWIKACPFWFRNLFLQKNMPWSVID